MQEWEEKYYIREEGWIEGFWEGFLESFEKSFLESFDEGFEEAFKESSDGNFEEDLKEARLTDPTKKLICRKLAREKCIAAISKELKKPIDEVREIIQEMGL